MTRVIVFIGFLLITSLEVVSQESTDQFRRDRFFSNQLVEMENIYPNPASTVAILNYSIKDPSKEVKVILHDLLGTMTVDYPLNPYENSLKIDIENFKEGVYFYTLSADGETKVTKKLIIKK